MDLEAALEARVAEILESLRLAAGAAWIIPVRVRATVQAKMRPAACNLSDCGWRIPGASGPLNITLIIDLPNGVTFEVTEDRESTRLRTRGG